MAMRERLSAPARAALIATAAVASACAVRYGLVEPAAMPAACDGAVTPLWCVPRWLAIQAFLDARLGWFALVTALLATLTRGRWIATVALAAAGAGLVLYSAGLAAPAALLAALVLAAPRVPAASASADSPGPAYGPRGASVAGRPGEGAARSEAPR